jgi:hypothetical protein
MKNKRQLLALLCTVVVVAVAAGCSGADGTLSASSGGLRIVMSTQSIPVAASTHGDDESHDGEGGNGGGENGDGSGRIQAAEVTFSSVLARNLDGELINVAIDLPVTVDLMALVEGRTAELPIGSLPPGTYDQIVVVMSKVALTTLNGTLIEITPPGGGWTAIVHVVPFEVIEGETTTVRIIFRPKQSFPMVGDRFEFRPNFVHIH